MRILTKTLTMAIAVALVILVLLLCACQNNNLKNKINVQSDTLYVEKVENMPKDFILGMDASCVPSLEASGVKYYDHNGEEKEVYEILSTNGVNYIRVRIWNDPFNSNGQGYGGGNCDIENAVKIGKRAAKYGMKLLVNFHYSDFWADPAKQMVPKAWKNMNIEDKAEALYAYTRECLEKLKNAGADIGMVQIGNETNGAMCGEFSTELGGWEKITRLMSAGSKAVREVCPNALVAVHFANPEKVSNYVSYSTNLDYYGVDYDVFASSYYPFWHGTLDNLAEVFSDVAEKYNKKVMVAETSYAYTARDTDFYGNTIGDGGGIVKNYPFTIQGQSTASFFFATGGKSNWTMNEKGEFSSVEDTINSAEGLIAMKGMQKLAQSKCYDSNADIFTDAGVVITGIWAAGDAAAHFGDNLGAEAKAATGEDDLKTALTEYKAAIDGLFQMTDAQKNAWSVIGNICNSNWDTDFSMVEGPDGTFTSDALELKAGQEYKVRQGASWDVNFGAEGFNSATNCVVEADGKYKVQLVWDGAQTGTITLIPVEG